MKYVLGIETSCDETGIGIYNPKTGLNADEIYSQINLHAQYGGVVPEIAARDHSRKLPKLIDLAINKAKIKYSDLCAIAYTQGPGLIGALMVGASFAKALALSLNIPAIGVNHLESHILIALLENPTIKFPAIGLLVSGGHTMLLLLNDIDNYKILGETLDDAAGEAFDKTAKLLNLNYPGGPELSKLAINGDPNFYNLPRALMQPKTNLDFSFSGLKTSVRNLIQKNSDINKIHLAASFEMAIVDSLVTKTIRAIEKTKIKNIILAGGVAANSRLRQVLSSTLKSKHCNLYIPKPRYCTDNGAMIAFNGYLKFKKNIFDNDPNLHLFTSWDLEEID